jgi:hypothetical protein
MGVIAVWLWPGRIMGRVADGSAVGACGLGEVLA